VQTATTTHDCHAALRGSNGHLQHTSVVIPKGTTVTVVGFWSGSEWPKEIPGQYVLCKWSMPKWANPTPEQVWISAWYLERSDV